MPELEDAVCPICLLEEETPSHLLVYCPFAWNIWMASYKWLGISTVLPKEGINHFLQHTFFCWSRNQRRGAWVVWIAVIWSIWSHRNAIIFKEGDIDIDKVIDDLQFKSWIWLRGKFKDFGCSLYEWQTHPSIYLSLL
ncbi:uncharacterized protein LOC130736131 [Lotus japonicus]|uniref:uncharacterized protein LOC130736131 n=1 Tax=Lotus japonicus TaxID=34305 RepID=UPI002586FC51|nr:uncharacterized protein LOC130736131 [Lotus japonicus]